MRNIIDNNKLFAAVAPKITCNNVSTYCALGITQMYYYFVSNKMCQVFT